MDTLPLSPMQRRLSAVVLATFVTVISAFNHVEPLAPDADFYRAMALGQPALKPFANRMLGPWLARHINGLAHLSVDQSFGIVALASIFVFFFVLSLFLLRLRTGIAALTAIVVLPFAWSLYYNAMLPDVLHAALAIVYFYLLFRQRWLAAALLLVPIFLARESTLLLVVVVIAVLWKQHRNAAWTQAAGTFLALLASHFAVSAKAGNIQGLSEPIYLLAKVPWNLARQFGIAFWIDTSTAPAPEHTLQLPHILGSHRIALLPWIPMFAEITVATILGCFGLGTLLLARLIYLRRRQQPSPQNHSEAWLRIAFWYGLISFLLAPALGTSTYRLISYAWPLFFLWMPFTLDTLRHRASKTLLAALLVLHFVAAALFMPQAPIYLLHLVGTALPVLWIFTLLLVVLIAATPLIFRLLPGREERSHERGD